MDTRDKILAHNLVNSSCKVQKGEHVLIVGKGKDTFDLVNECVKEVYAVGGYPHFELKDSSILRSQLMNLTEDHAKTIADLELYKIKKMDAYIAIAGGDNTYEMSDVPNDKITLYDKYTDEALRYRVEDTKWVILRYPNGSAAQAAKMSKEAFADYYYKVCCLDYSKMDRAMDSIKALMEKTDKVRITGKGTDLTFSIKGLPAVKCAGECNIPDGEIYTAPVKDSVNGYITYNTPSLYSGTVYENIRFEFENGKIVNATANYSEKLNEILDSDEGARYIGEFAIGVNPYVTEPMLDTLFDEKIAGSIHFTPGCCYDDCNNSNKSQIHWDLVFIQTPEYGGGEIYFDDVLIRKDGRFVLDSLECLNPENLI